MVVEVRAGGDAADWAQGRAVGAPGQTLASLDISRAWLVDPATGREGPGELVVRDGISDAAATRARAAAHSGRPDPRVFRTTYIPLEGNFTSNLRGGDNFVQVGLGLSTFYDDHVKENVERNMMAIRSAVILALSEADPVEITTLSGKEALKEALKNAINRVLTNREGFGGIDDVYFTSFVTQ